MDINEAKNSLSLGKFMNFIDITDRNALIKLAEESNSIDELVKKPMFEVITRQRRKTFNMKLEDVIKFEKNNG